MVLLALATGLTSCSGLIDAIFGHEDAPVNTNPVKPDEGGEDTTFPPTPGTGGTIDLAALQMKDMLSDDDGNPYFIVGDSMTLTGKLAINAKICIADSATVTLNGVTIEGKNEWPLFWAGITCLGNATIILADGSENVVTGFYHDYPGIQVGSEGTTLTITGESDGTGKLTASSHGVGAGIGGYKSDFSFGDIVISGGNVTASSNGGAGIGSAYDSKFGSITITGGTVSASSKFGTGIGCGQQGVCGDITITYSDNFVIVTAKKGCDAYRPIGLYSNNGQSKCGKIIVGKALIYDGGENIDYDDKCFSDLDFNGDEPDLDGLEFSEEENTWILTNPDHPLDW